MKPTDFERRLSRAVRERGYVMPELHVLSVPVTPVPRHDFVDKNFLHQAEEWAKQNLFGSYSTTDADGRGLYYDITYKAIDKYLSQAAVDKSRDAGTNMGIHLAVLKVLPEVISNTIQTEIHPNYRKIGRERKPENGYENDSLIHRRYGAVNVDGMLCRVKITMKEVLISTKAEQRVRNLAYSYEVAKIEVLDIKPSTLLTPSKELHSAIRDGGTKVQKKSELPKIDLAVLLRGVEKSYEPKKLLEESLRESCRAWLLVRMGNTKVNPNQNRKKGRGI